MAERVVEAVPQRLALRLRALGRLAGRLEDLAGGVVQLASGHARAHQLADALERRQREPVPGHDVAGGLSPDHERARHVGVAARALVARPHVDDDRCARRKRPAALLVPGGAVGARPRR